MLSADLVAPALVGTPPPGELCQLALTKDLRLVAPTGAAEQGDARKILIRLADSDDTVVGMTNTLLRRRYSDVGIAANASLVEAKQSRNVMSLAAISEDQVIGTMTVRVRLDDSTPLKCEQSYADVVSREIAEGARLSEITGFSFDDANPLSFPLMGALFHSAFIFASAHGVTRNLIEVHPHHAPFYRRFLGMELVGEERTCERAGRPAVLLRLGLDYVRAQVVKHAGHHFDGTCRQIYKCFFRPEEAQAIGRRMFAKEH